MIANSQLRNVTIFNLSNFNFQFGQFQFSIWAILIFNFDNFQTSFFSPSIVGRLMVYFYLFYEFITLRSKQYKNEDITDCLKKSSGNNKLTVE